MGRKIMRDDRLNGGEDRVVRKGFDAQIGASGYRARIEWLHTCQHLEQGRLAGAVDADDGHAVALLQADGHVMKKLFETEGFGEILSGEDVHGDSEIVFINCARKWKGLKDEKDLKDS